MNISKYKSDITFQFLLFLIRKYIYKNNTDYIDSFDMNDISKVNFDRLFSLITTHKVELIVLPILSDIDISRFDYQRLSLRAKQIVMKQLHMEKLQADIVQSLDENGIVNAVFKGVALDKKLYGNQNKRVYRDIDLLINDYDIDKTHELLINLGFKLGKDLRYTPEFIKKYPNVKKGIKDLIYIHQQSKTILELHWRIATINNLKIELSNSDCFEVFSYGEKNYYTLRNEYELAYLIQHGAESGWHRLKWLIDIVDYLKVIDIDKPIFLKIMQESKGYNYLLADLQFILKNTIGFEHSILDLDSHVSKRYLLTNYRQKYIARRIYESSLSMDKLTIKELFYKFVICSNKLHYLKIYAIGFYYKRKAIKQNK
ncbi:nucleotidyltransferase family protein [Francisella philomiragia]|uniref:nucleotidyltransferase family protein n=2 Tax=Francisella philomiragia TaxID=28110 RepID=UPI003518D7C3